MQNFVGLMALIAIAALLVWSGFCAWQVRHSFLKWGGVGLAAVLALAVTSISALTITGMIKQHTRRAPVPDLKVEATPERIARGKALVDGFCSACHSKSGTLTGGLDIGKDFPIPIGSFVSSNLTPTGALKHWSDGEIFRAIRNGVDAEGHWLTVMSYTNAGKLSDDDIQAVIAFIRSLPAAGAQTPDPPDQVSLLGVVMLGAGMLPSGKPVVTSSVTAPPKGPNVQFGEYILSYQDCRECHGENLAGGVPGQMAPLGPDLNLVKDWKLAEFLATMRTGIDPNGHELSEKMPWRPIGRMDDDELDAVYEYLTHRPDPDAPNVTNTSNHDDRNR
ncbi:c-type cytochrome [Bradyrhizobium sp. Ash2021]|uniref:c-type cytochrome n=1 Tax=Bradyrhizobium sp. Ash2021 TaxID=2954771 RepID=UPI002815316E|nr:c-type cytochrome [Bradyrhizobium sp. Ash2021]WMT79407.1 cytochrome c [Bradyrhizobium sp. Ash2021]